MRTKVEKRRVRQDPASALGGGPVNSQPAPLSSQENAGIAASGPGVLAPSALTSAAGDLHPEAERRPVSISEAQRLAAANHVVVALGPPVIMGPTRLMLDGKGDGGGNVDGGGGIAPALTDGVNKVYDKLSAQSASTQVKPEEKAIKKPPKKRRNNEKKAEVALDLSTTSAVHGSTGKELHPAMAESLMIPAPLPVQLQQPPITPPTPSPQHPLTCSPQHGSLHNSALLCRSPPNPTHLLQQTPPSSSEPVLTDTASDTVDMMHATDVSDLHTATEEGSSVTQFVRSDSEVLPVPESDLVLPLSQTHQVEVQSLVRQPEAIQTLDAEEGDVCSATSTSLLQPPTWLLTPQENPPGREGSDHESLAASDQRTAHAVKKASSEPLVSSPTKTSKKAERKTACKSKSAKSRKTADEEVKDRSETGKKNGSRSAVTSQPKDSAVTASANSTAENNSISLPKGNSSSCSQNSKSTAKPKSEKPQKRKPKEGDEDSQRRLQQIEDTINSVIARYVYNSDTILDFDKLRQAAREADAKAADTDNKTTAKSCVPMETDSAAAVTCNDNVTSVSPERMAESQHGTVPCSETSVASVSPKRKKKAAPKKKQPEMKAASSEGGDGKSPSGAGGAVETQADSPKKKSKKGKDKKAKEVAEESQNGNDSPSSKKKATKAQARKPTKAQLKKAAEAQSKETSEAQSVETTVSQSQETLAGSTNATENDDIKPPPAKKKKTSKKKGAAAKDPVEPLPSSDAILNGHLETEPVVETPKPARKKKKSKPKGKTDTKASDEKSQNSLVPNGTDASQGADAISTSSAKPDEKEKETPKSQAKGKPKKAKKRKSDNSEDQRLSEKKDATGKEDKAAGDENRDSLNSESGSKNETDAKAKADSESSKPPPKKKKKKEPKEGEKAETKKKKSPSKSKKSKDSATGAQSTETGEAASVQNSLPDTENTENGDTIPAENGETKSTEEAGTSTEEGQEAKSTTTVEKKVKKTLDEVICPDCGHKTRGQAALSRHMKKLHEKSMSLPYPCPKQPNCDYSASKVSLLARHMLTHSLYMCSRCQFTVDAKDKYEEHLQTEHNVKLDCKLCKKCCRYVKCDTVPMEQHLEVCQGPVPFTCDVCGKQFKYESSLKVHHHTHFPDQPKLYHCTQCEYASNYRANLHKHIQNMHMQRPRDIKCQLCEKMFSTEDNMRRHMKIHTQVRPYKCHKCEKAFKSQCALRGHLVSHEVARPYKCNIDNCQREFRTPKFLKSHQEEFHRLIPKKYHCKVEGCNFSFFKLSHLKRHEISHTGERNFHCNHPGCGKSFRHADNLKVHLRQHTNERPISCPRCKFTCRQKSSLQWHMKKEHNQSLPAGTAEEEVGKEVVIPLDGKPLEGFTLPKGMTFPEGFKLPEGLTLPDGVKLPDGVDLAEGVEVVELEKINVIIPAGEGEELPVTITELRPMDLYDFHSDNDSSDEATPGVFKRDKTKMASAAPLPPAPKELLMKNAVFDVLGEEGFKPAVEEGSSKSKKKKSPSKKAAKPKETAPKEGGEKAKKDNSKQTGADEDKKKKKKKTPPTKKASAEAKASPEAKKKAPATKAKKKAAKQEKTEEHKEQPQGENSENQAGQVTEGTGQQDSKDQPAQVNEETVNENKEKADDGSAEKQAGGGKEKEDSQSEEKQDAESNQQDGQSTNDTKAEEVESEAKAPSKSPSKPKKAPSKKKTVTKSAPKEEETGGKKEKTTKTKAPAKVKKSPKTRASPKKPTSPKGKPAKAATRKTPPRKAAAAKKGGKTGGKKTPAKKGSAKKKTTTKKKSPPKKKPVKKVKEKEEKSVEVEDSVTEKKEEQVAVAEPKPKEPVVPQNRIQTTRRLRETRNSLAAAEEASSPIRPSSPMDSEEENMPQGAGSPYREFDSQDIDESSPEPRDSPSPPPSPPRVEEQPVSSPVAELESSPKGEEDVPEMAETQEEADISDVEDIMNDIPLTPPRAPAPPPPQESSDEEDMIPSPPTHMPLSADTSDTAAPSSVLTDQPGSQAPDFQQPHSREEFQQPPSHQDFQQPHSREEFQQPLSQQPQSVEYPQHHSREEIIQPHSREEYPQHHSREEYPQHHSREEYPQHHSREEYPQHHSREEYPQHHSREEYPQPHSREDYPQPVSREDYSQPVSREDYSQPVSREDYSQPVSREDYSQPLSREDYSQPQSREEYPQPLSREEYSQPHSREEYTQPLSREEYPQQHSREYTQPPSREEYSQQHSREDLQPQGSVPEPMSESVHSVRSEGLPEDVPMPHSVTPYDAVAAQTIPTSEAESAYQYLQGLAQSGEPISEPLAGEPSRLQQLEALAEKPHEDSRGVTDMVKSPVGAAPTSVITSLSPSAPSLPISTPETSSRRMEILSTDRQVDQTLIRDSPALPRLGEGGYDAFSALNPLAASAARDNSNLFPAPPSTPTFMRLTESEAMLQRQRMTTPFLPTAQPPERSLSRLPESSLQPPNPTALLRRPATMAEGMFSGTPGMPQAMPRNPFTNTWAGQDVRPSHWGQAPTYLQRPTNAPTTPFPFPTKDNYQFMFDPTVRSGVTDRNMFASLSGSQSQRDLASEPNPFQLDRFDLSTYFGSHPYSGATGLDYSRSAVSAASKTFDERYRQTAVSMSEFRPLPPTTSTDMFSGIGVGVNSLNSASFNLDKYTMYGRDPMYHAAAQQLSDNTNSAFLTHATPTQHSMFDRDYPHRSLYPHQNPAYPLFNERQYPATAKLTGHPTPTAMSHERDFMARPSANENQMQDPYRCGMLYNVVNRYSFE